ncbi:MAG: hypothetical protein SH856_14355 [Flavobacteriales bacterium]|nr:hypothetical protein [Flavobacteriales bacterium]
MKNCIFFISALTALSLVSCLKPNEFPDEPALEFGEFLRYSDDSAKLILNFTDGDGNFGLTAADTSGTYCSQCMAYYNLYCEYYELQNGQWVHLPLIPFLPFNQIAFYYRVPWVMPTGQEKAQQGELEITMRGNYGYWLESEFDTARFEIHIVDRSLNESNVVRTPAFIKP